MKNRRFVSLTLWSLFMIGTTLFAQSAHELRVNIPFDFNVANRTVEAGQYTLQQLASAMQIRQRDGRVVALVTFTTNPKAESIKEGQMLFHRYGETYFLSEVLMPYSNSANKLIQSKHERELAQGGSKAQEIAVTVRNR